MSKLSSRDLCFVFNTLSECLLVERSERRSSLPARPRINSSLGCSAGWNLGFGVGAPSYSNDCSPTPAICTTFLVMIVTTQVKQLSRQFIIVTRFFIAGYLIQPTATRVYFWTSGSLLYAPRRFSSTAQPTCQSPLHCWSALLWLRTVAAHVRPHSVQVASSVSHACCLAEPLARLAFPFHFFYCVLTAATFLSSQLSSAPAPSFPLWARLSNSIASRWLPLQQALCSKLCLTAVASGGPFSPLLQVAGRSSHCDWREPSNLSAGLTAPVWLTLTTVLFSLAIACRSAGRGTCTRTAGLGSAARTQKNQPISRLS